MRELIEAVSILEQQSMAIIDSLTDTALSARSLGMDRLANRSEKQAEMIRSAVDAISKASAVAINENFRQAEQGSLNILNTALAVASLRQG
jgi:hypothetical protein